MKFTELKVGGFGVWSGLTLESLSPQMTVIYGANEAGKTTILECLRGVLYGFSPARRGRYLPPLHGGEAGGSIGLLKDRQLYTIARSDDGSRLLGGVAVTGPDGSIQGDSQLGELLDGINEAVYTNIFSVGLRELQELATLDDGEAASWLYDLSTGLDGVSISETLRELRASRTRIVSPTSDKSQILDLLSQRDTLREEIEDLSTLNDRYWELSTERIANDESIGASEAALAGLTVRLHTLDTAISLRDPWRERAMVEAKLAAFGALADFPPDALRRLEALLSALKKTRQKRSRIKQRWLAARSRRRKIKVNERLWRQAARITALAEHEHWIATLDEQLRTAKQQVSESESRLGSARTQCGLPDGSLTSSEALSASVASELRGPAKQLRAARTRLKQARDACSALKVTQDTRREEVAAALSGRGESSLTEALEKQGELVAQFRRRLQLDDRLDQMAMHRQELEGKHETLLDRQVVPLWLLITLAVVFVVGGSLVMAGLILPWGMLTAAIGGLLAAGAVASKFAWERSAANRLEANERQLKMLKRQLEQAKAERSELDELLPAGGGALAGRLQKAEEELSSLEELLSVDARRQAADDESAAAKSRLNAAGQEWNQSLRRWREALASAGLPHDLSPGQAKQMISHAGSLQPLERQLQNARDERDRLQREHRAIATRIEQLAAEAGLATPEGEQRVAPLVEQLRRLRREIAAQEELADRRRVLDERLARLRRLGLKYTRRARRLARRRRELYHAAGALDENDFRRRAEQRAQLDELLSRRAALSQRIQAELQGELSEQEIDSLIGLPPGQLEQRRQELDEQRQTAADCIKRLLERRGSIAHEQALLADDRRLPQKQVELDAIETRLAEAASRWRTLAMTEHLIETVKDDYERNRQPEVLREASRYLERMTEGRYRRVWTPLSEHALRVDDDEGRALAIELLSTGAREQLFLCLRLALATRFAAQGKAMPLVLDDVLVNFDKERAGAAAALFIEFATAGHQLLVFTCHEHIADLFRRSNCDVRRLPTNADPSPKIVGPHLEEQAPAIEPPRRRREKRHRDTPRIEPPESQEDSQSLVNSGSNGESPEQIPAMAPEPIAQAVPLSDTPIAIDLDRRHRVDSSHEVAPVKARRNRWSAEEFEGELQDQVRVQ